MTDHTEAAVLGSEPVPPPRQASELPAEELLEGSSLWKDAWVRLKKNKLEEEIEVASVKITRKYSLAETDIGRRLLIAVRIDNRRFGEPRECSLVYAPAVESTAEHSQTGPTSEAPLESTAAEQ